MIGWEICCHLSVIYSTSLTIIVTFDPSSTSHQHSYFSGTATHRYEHGLWAAVWLSTWLNGSLIVLPQVEHNFPCFCIILPLFLSEAFLISVMRLLPDRGESHDSCKYLNPGRNDLRYWIDSWCQVSAYGPCNRSFSFNFAFDTTRWVLDGSGWFRGIFRANWTCGFIVKKSLSERKRGQAENKRGKQSCSFILTWSITIERRPWCCSRP